MCIRPPSSQTLSSIWGRPWRWASPMTFRTRATIRMPAEEQADGQARYLLVPRTLIFARRGNSYLLLKGAPDKRLWSGLYNGVGGHLERGEDVLNAARREFQEETSLEADLWLCGTIIVDSGSIGIGLYVFTGEVTGGTPQPSTEGQAEWISVERLGALPAVSDLVPLLSQIHSMKSGDPPFSGRSFYDQDGRLQITFHG